MLNLNFNPFPVIDTERLVLRQLDVADAGELFLLRNHPIVMQYTHMQTHQNAAETAAFIELLLTNELKKVGITWAIVLKDTSKLVGTINYWNIEPENGLAEIGYILHPGFHGQGIMQETITAVIDYGFQSMKLKSILALPEADNAASVKLLKRNGFVYRGRLEEEAEMCVYALVSSD